MVAPRVVVIGGGVVGAALVDELSARGWDDITLVDQGPLPATGGSTSHAPGVVFQSNSSKTMTQLARYTVEKFSSLDLDGEPCFLQTGGLEVATTPERLAELRRRHGWVTAWGVEAHLLSPEESVEKFPLLDRDVVLGGLFVPTDGVAKAVRGVEAQLRRAVGRGGVRLLERHKVLDVRVEDGKVAGVVTDQGEIAADIVVCCAGIWGPRIAAMVGMTLPLTPLAHQLVWTGPVPPLAGRTEEMLRPVLRHQDGDLYYRENFEGLGVGYYGHRPMPIAVEDLADFAEDRTMPSVLEVTEADVVRAMAEWLVDGYCSSFDLHECDVNRFEQHQLAPEYVLTKDCQNFVEVYDILHPLQPMEQLRPIRTSPFYQRQQELDAFFLEANGWERPQWYDVNKHLLLRHDVPEHDPWASRYWSPIVGAEAKATREGVAMYDMTALKRIEVGGRGAAAFLQRLTTGDVDKSVGSVTYCLLLDHDGGIRSDITVARLAPDLFQVGANGNLDVDWFQRHLPEDGTVFVRDITAGTCCVGVWGPRARDVVQPLTDTDFSHEGFKYFRGKRAYLGSVPVTALRLSYVGELGWELYTTADQGQKLWDTLWEAGREYEIFAGGRGAFNSLRLEKGYRSFGADMTYEHDPYEAGLGFAVKLGKDDFIGKQALLKRKESVTRRLSCLTLETRGATVLGKEPVYDSDRCVGYVTSAAYGYTIDRGIAYAWLPAELAEPGTTVQIGWFDQRLPAVVSAEPLVDPEMKRIRS